MKEVFRLAGRIQRVDLPRDKEDRSRGFAVVEYDHPVEAVQAISMFNNQFLYERQMAVRMDRANDGTKLPEGLKGVGMGLGSNGEPLKDVARNLPSSNSQQSAASLSSGILGAVPNPALQVASALSGLNSINPAALSSLAGSAGVFQAGSLLGGADLSLANSLVSNPLVQTPGAFNNSAQGSMSNFGRPESGYGAAAALGNSRTFQNQYDGGNKATPFGAGFGNDRDATSYNKLSDPAALRGPVSVPKSTSGFSRKIVISNVSIFVFS